MSATTTDPAADPGEARRRALLDAALGVFLRFGFRKTSMDEVARAAQVSRQGLYLHFDSKEALFRATVKHVLETSLEGAGAALRDSARPLEGRLVAAFDQWVGRYVGMYGAGAADLAEATGALVAPMMKEYEELFLEAVARAVGASLAASKAAGAAYKRAGLSARQLADTLWAAARGLKHSATSREEFGRQMTVAVRAICAAFDGGGGRQP
jgi:AcrR family transcriptional regulator